MLSIDPNELSERENYKFLVGSIIPRPIAFVTTLSEDGVLNGAPFSYFNIVTSNPPMISISVQRINGKMKDTARHAITKGELVIHIVDEQNVERVNVTAASVSSGVSEVTLANMTQIASKRITVPGVEEAKIRMECTLERAIEIGGTEDKIGCDLLIARIVQFHVDSTLYNRGRIDARQLKAVSRLAGASYAKVGETFEIERPK